MTHKKNIPHFHSEAEEAEWWDRNKEETAKWMEEAVVSGKTTTLSAVLDRHKNGRGYPNVSLNLNAEDLTLARAQAAQRGLSDQAYLEMLIHNALMYANRTT